MSKIVEARMEQDVTHEAEWVAALQKTFGAAGVRVSPEPQRMVGYNGETGQAHIVVERGAVGAVYCDVGFRRDGRRLVLVGDHLDLERPAVKSKLDVVRQLYAESRAMQALRARGYGVNRTTLVDGSVVLTATR